MSLRDANRLQLDDGFHRTVVDNLYDGVYYVDRGRRITYWNRGAERLSGYTAGDVVGSRCYANILNHVDAAGTVLCQGLCPLAATMRDGTMREKDVFLRHRAGHRVPVRVRTAPIRDSRGVIVGGVEVFNDSSELLMARREADRLRDEAFHDALTGLPNRRYGEMALTARASELLTGGRAFGVIWIDVDRFKGVNDRHGHATGDDALVTVARTMRSATRQGDEIVRWGGDEFLGIVSDVHDDALREAAERLRALVARSRVRAGTRSIRVTVSVGAASSREAEPVSDLLGRADGALYVAKGEGGNRVYLAG
jgi:diguanylate cyclase (GGDEF)-like protein/PAS domain S-box-containing protein